MVIGVELVTQQEIGGTPAKDPFWWSPSFRNIEPPAALWVMVNYLKIRVNMVRVPVQWISFHFQIISRKVARRIPQIVELVPK